MPRKQIRFERNVGPFFLSCLKIHKIPCSKENSGMDNFHRRHTLDWPHYNWANGALISIGQQSTQSKTIVLCEVMNVKTSARDLHYLQVHRATKLEWITSEPFLTVQQTIICSADYCLFSRPLSVQQTTIAGEHREYTFTQLETQCRKTHKHIYIYINKAHCPSLATWCEVKNTESLLKFQIFCTDIDPCH